MVAEQTRVRAVGPGPALSSGPPSPPPRPAGTRNAVLNTEARTADADVLSRRCVLMRLRDFSLERYRRALRQSAGAVVVILPRAPAAGPQDAVQVNPPPPHSGLGHRMRGQPCGLGGSCHSLEPWPFGKWGHLFPLSAGPCTLERLCPRRTPGDVWGHLWCHSGCSRHLVAGATDATQPHRALLGPGVSSAQGDRSALNERGLIGFPKTP